MDRLYVKKRVQYHFPESFVEDQGDFLTIQQRQYPEIVDNSFIIEMKEREDLTACMIDLVKS